MGIEVTGFDEIYEMLDELETLPNKFTVLENKDTGEITIDCDKELSQYQKELIINTYINSK
ncbi:MAG: hypothetical protein ACRDD7_06835 [Peptostreptococcaceae bacterium]